MLHLHSTPVDIGPRDTDSVLRERLAVYLDQQKLLHIDLHEDGTVILAKVTTHGGPKNPMQQKTDA